MVTVKIPNAIGISYQDLLDDPWLNLSLFMFLASMFLSKLLLKTLLREGFETNSGRIMKTKEFFLAFSTAANVGSLFWCSVV